MQYLQNSTGSAEQKCLNINGVSIIVSSQVPFVYSVMCRIQRKTKKQIKNLSIFALLGITSG